MERAPMTRAGYERLSEKLRRLQRIEMPEVVKAIEVAREHGDLKENAEYHAAKERQGLIHATITDLQEKLSKAEIIDQPEATGKVVFACTVVVYDVNHDKESEYKIVGPYEADIDQGLLSYQSPIGMALLGKEEGDEVKVTTPGGLRELEIVEIR